MILYQCEWANTIIVKTANNKWTKPDSGWVKNAYEQMKTISRRGGTQEEIDTAIGNEMEKYLRNKPKALVIVHEQNFASLSSEEKHFATIIIDSNLNIRINPRYSVYLCLPPNSNFRRKFKINIFSKFMSHAGMVLKDSGYGAGLSSLKAPYRIIHGYRVNSYNGNLKWDNKNIYNISTNVIEKTTYEYLARTSWLKNRFFNGNNFQRNLTTQEINEIKNFNNYDKITKEVNFDNSLTISEYAYFYMIIKT